MIRRPLILCLALFGGGALAQSPLTGTAQISFTIVDRGSASLITDGSGNNVGVGYASIQLTAGNIVPAGVAVLGFRTNGTLVSEVGVPVSPVLPSGRIYVEVSGPVNTGIAIANPTNQAATISFSFTDSSGVDSGGGSIVLPPYGQISKFVDQEPFNGGGNFRGAFSFTSNVPISVIALRGLINERGEFLMSSLPVADTSSSNFAPVTLPHFADGGGWTTQVILVNPGDSPIAGSIRLVGQSGQSLSTFPFSIGRRSSFKQLTPGTNISVQSGSVQIVPNAGSVSPTAVAIFSYRPAGVTVSEAAVGAVSGTALRMYAEASGAPGSALSKESGVAIANLSTTPANVTFEQSAPDGSTLATTSITVPGNGQITKFLGDIFPSQSLQPPFEGVLRITAPQPGLSVVGLRSRYNERGDFLITTTPPVNEATPTSERSTAYVFPEVANGGGYTTQFLVFGRSAGQSTTGKVRFTNQDGTLPLGLNCPAPTDTGSTLPEVIRQVFPQYSEAARQARITGVVILQGLVHEDGSISVTRFIQTVGYGLDENAQAAIEQWRFCPGTRNGQPVAAALTITVSFNFL